MADDALDLFTAIVDVPDVRSPAPSAPGSKTSELAARAIDANSPLRSMSLRRVMIALSQVSHPISREELASRTGMKESSLCARLADLSPIWVQCRDGACTSKAGLRVNGYSLTPAGRERVRKAQEPIR